MLDASKTVGGPRTTVASGPTVYSPSLPAVSLSQPDYNANTIILKLEFFNEVNDRRVTLTFHFWSGTQVTYYITKSGTSVTGSTT